MACTHFLILIGGVRSYLIACLEQRQAETQTAEAKCETEESLEWAGLLSMICD